MELFYFIQSGLRQKVVVTDYFAISLLSSRAAALGTICLLAKTQRRKAICKAFDNFD